MNMIFDNYIQFGNCCTSWDQSLECRAYCNIIVYSFLYVVMIYQWVNITDFLSVSDSSQAIWSDLTSVNWYIIQSWGVTSDGYLLITRGHNLHTKRYGAYQKIKRQWNLNHYLYIIFLNTYNWYVLSSFNITNAMKQSRGLKVMLDQCITRTAHIFPRAPLPGQLRSKAFSGPC